MKKRIAGALLLIITALFLTGCSTVGDKTLNYSIIYGVAAILSLVLLIGCCTLVKNNKLWFIILFSSVLVVNIGYTFLSMSTGLEMALNANRIAYLGSVFLPAAMLMIIMDVTNTVVKKWLPVTLFILGAMVFLLAASPGILNIYYKDWSFQVVNGVSTLVKVYGPLHPVYLFYLVGYFIAMIVIIGRASAKKTFSTTSRAAVLAIAVFVNIGVWLIEQLSSIEFEFLSISYIISELFLLGIHLVISENQHLKDLVMQKEEELHTAHHTEAKEAVSSEVIEFFTRGVSTLTPTERSIYDSYLSGMSTKDIMRQFNIKENTLKFHNKNIYSKLGVSSRKQLLGIARAIEANS